MRIPAAVKNAIEGFVSPQDGFEVFPPKPTESSFIYKWGVRMKGKLRNGEACLGWAAELTRKRTREEEVEDIKRSGLVQQDPKRVRILLETKRIIVNNLPFCHPESNAGRVFDQVCLKDEFQEPVNAKMVNHAIVELYATAKEDATCILRENDMTTTKLLTAVVDFWTCKVQHAKYLGLQVYFVTKDWRRESILLGARRFEPTYGDRVGGIRRPFRRWLEQMLTDFGLSSANLFGGMSDAGPDVKWMLQSGLNVQWEWCLAHLSNAAAKTACGLVNNKKDSKNPGMTELLDKVCKTVRQVRDSEVLGDLFKALCEMEGHERATMLIDYKSHRFLGITRVVERVVDRWNELTRWFEARQKKARADGKAPKPFLLEDHRLDLVQLMSLLKPITVLNQKSQSDSCSQVDSLLHLYRLRLQTLNTARPLRDYRSTPTQPAHFGTNELTPIVQKTRELLAAAFDKNFFSRYTDRSKLRQQSFVFEMQLLLYPTFKNLDLNLALVTRLCYAKRDSNRDACERMGNLVRDAVIGKARAIMLAMAADEPLPPVEAAVSLNASDDEIVEMFGAISQPQLSDDVREGQIDEEIQRWRAEPAALGVLEDGAVENILQFWQRQAESSNYRYLPKLARAVFALPCSSAQIERDFGSSGLMVRAQRANLSSYNIEMSAFLSCNPSLINVAQCRRIPPSEISNHIPSHILVGALDDEDEDEEFGSQLATYFSGATLGDDDEDTI